MLDVERSRTRADLETQLQTGLQPVASDTSPIGALYLRLHWHIQRDVNSLKGTVTHTLPSSPRGDRGWHPSLVADSLQREAPQMNWWNRYSRHRASPKSLSTGASLALTEPHPSCYPAVVTFFDADRFSYVNDHCGFAVIAAKPTRMRKKQLASGRDQ